MPVYVDNLQTAVPVDEKMNSLVRRVVEKALAEELSGEDAEVSVVLVDDEYMRDLNFRYRQIDSPTDVLSFAMEEGEELADAGEGRILGDIVISLPTALRQSMEYGHSLDRELGFLVVHGVLHLLGYDHDTPQGEQEMLARTEAILSSLDLVRA
ncbi:MAG: rRNA maturation RNase YbeY [Bacillota bacterium]|uniref:rRNA maturation RNase YbeY n=1 Tax=Desulfurispora thermophila TaxID=265470 RepID=UPI0003781100|nr:rRNA maturation RNase YbeY [Desulfurispora thermophila]